MNKRFLKAIQIIKNEQINKIQTTPVEIYEVGENKRKVIYNPQAKTIRCSCPDTPKEKGIMCKHIYAFYIYTRRRPDGLHYLNAFGEWVLESISAEIDEILELVEHTKTHKNESDTDTPPLW